MTWPTKHEGSDWSHHWDPVSSTSRTAAGEPIRVQACQICGAELHELRKQMDVYWQMYKGTLPLPSHLTREGVLERWKILSQQIG